MKLLFRDFKNGVKSALFLGANEERVINRISMLKLYYRAIVLPMIISVIIGAIFISFYGRLPNLLIDSILPYMSIGILSGINSSIVIEASIIFLYLVLFPFAIMTFSLIFHFISKILLRLYNGTQANTFSASVYAALPFVLFFWVLMIPQLGAIFYVLLIWSIVAFVYASSAKHNISKGRALGSLASFIIVTLLIGFAIIGFLALL